MTYAILEAPKEAPARVPRVGGGTELGLALIAITVVALLSMSLCSAALRGRLRQA